MDMKESFLLTKNGTSSKNGLLYRFLFFFLFLSSSWDIFAVIKLSGFTIRFFYLLEILLLLFYFLKRNRISLFPGHNFFIFWMFFIAISLPNSPLFVRNIGYFLWLIFSYILLILITNYLKTAQKFMKYFKIYIFSFVIMGLFGFFQFILGLAGISLMTTQWWIEGVIPRINGLSYEPSYYSTYMSAGVVLLYWLTFVEKRKIFLLQSVITLFLILVIILSSSRIGILSLIFVIFFHILYKFFIPFFKGKINLTGFKVSFIFLIVVLTVIIILSTYLDLIRIFLMGSGLFGTPSHSLSERLQGMIDTFKVFLNNPIIGVSLGGIPSHRAELYGITIFNQSEAKEFEGLNVILEVLAASGIFGFLFFLLFWLNLIKMSFSLKKKIRKSFKEINNSALNNLLSITNALGIMLITEIFALTMNQNILRPYFWVSLAFYLSSLKILYKVIKS